MTILAVVNENSNAYLTVNFKDKNGVAAVPTSISYRIDCVTNGQEVLTDTPFTPAAASIEIELTKVNNACIGSVNKYEERCVTVTAVYGVDDEIAEEYRYNLKNLLNV